MPTCNNYGYEGTGNYCPECGKPYKVKRLAVASLLHEVAHLFTHLNKGFGFTQPNYIPQHSLPESLNLPA